ncbi:hypothetical protein [Ferroacidibacillus organovorans]|uniref:hypothetical protein n=1 Tax=Ferroacidibacillus organovorans TaxID=1765683 RepID=UPI000831200F|nr:hypothetical protein [Ferroacidibacillus organovorans]
MIAHEDGHHGALQAQLEQAASRACDVPGADQKRFSIRTPKRYMALYDKGGLDALHNALRQIIRVIRQELLTPISHLHQNDMNPFENLSNTSPVGL